MKQIMTLVLMMVLSLTARAQDRILDKYAQLGDVNSIIVSQGMLDQIPAGALDAPGLKPLLEKMESLRVLSSDKLKAAKQMAKKLPQQLEGEGFEKQMQQTVDGAMVRIYVNRRQPNVSVLIVTTKQKTIVARVIEKEKVE